MISSRRANRGVLVLALGGMATAPLLSACGAGQVAVTKTERSVIDGTNASVGGLLVRYAYIDNESGYDVVPAGSDVRAYLWIFNNGVRDDTLDGVTSTAAQSITIEPEGAASPGPGPTPSVTPASPSTASTSSSASLVIPSAGHVALIPGRYHLLISGVRTTLRSGVSIPLTFHFADAGDLTMQVPVQVPGTPPPAGSASPTRSAKPGNAVPAG